MTREHDGHIPSGASPDGLPPLRDVIAAYDLAAKKSLGQNFILDFNITRRIARVAGPLDQRTVLEIGPGPGGLTRALFLEGAANVLAIERDRRCLDALAAICARYPGRLRVEEADALEVNYRKLDLAIHPEPFIIANLPYNIATPLLIGWLETEPWPPWFGKMILMFQKEVAERIVALPGSKAYGRLAVISQWRTIPRLVFTLPPSAFTPPPKIASAVVEFVPRPEPHPACDVRTLGRVTAAAFGQRRKMLRSSLKQIAADPLPLLDAAGIDPNLRAEALAVRDFARLAFVADKIRGIAVESA